MGVDATMTMDGRMISEPASPGWTADGVSWDLAVQPELSRATCELVHFVPEPQTDRCRSALAFANPQRLTCQTKVERMPAVANPHIEPLDLDGQSRVQPKHVSGDLDSSIPVETRCARSTVPAIAPRWTPSRVVPPWMSATSLCSASAK